MKNKLEKFYRLSAVQELTGLKRSKIREMVAVGAFPKPIPLCDSGRAIGWLESELVAWQQAQIRKRPRG